MGLFSSIAGIIGAAKKRKAIDRASSVLQDGAQRGIDTIGATNTQNQANIGQVLQTLAPFISTGAAATGAQGDLLGLGGNDKQAAAIASLKDSPLFQSLFRTGSDTILQNASATGGLRSGNIQSNLANFGSDTLAKVIQNQLTNLGGLSGQGLQGAGIGAQTTLGGNANASGMAGAIADLFGTQAGAQASGIIGKASASQEMLTNSMKAIQDAVAAIAGVPGGGQMAQLAASAGKLF